MKSSVRKICGLSAVSLVLSVCTVQPTSISDILGSFKTNVNSALITVIKALPASITYRVAQRYIAGETIEDAVNVVKKLNASGIIATLDILGEAVTNKEDSIRAKERYLATLDAIDSYKINANISIKPSQFGLALDPEFCYQQVSELLQRAQQYHNFVRLDMESSALTDATLELYKKLHRVYPNCGIVIQANLKRTMNDIQLPEFKDTNYRLCKGVYKESNAVAFNDSLLTRNNFINIAKYLFAHGNYVAFATQDDLLIGNVQKLIDANNVDKKSFEFQTLYGVREDLRDQINKAGYRVRVYVPFGTNWYPYAMRRIQESPNVARLVVTSLLAGKK